MGQILNSLNDDYGFEPEEQEGQDYDFEPEQQETEQDNSLVQSAASLGAHAVGSLAKLPDTLMGLITDTGEQAKKSRQYLNEKLGLGFDDEFITSDSPFNYDLSIKAPFKFLGDYIPSPEAVDKFIDTSFEGYLAPKSDKQKLANNIAEDIIFSALNRNPKNLIRNFLIPAGSNLLKKAAELFGVDPNSSEIIKMVSWIAADMASISDPRQMLTNRFNQTRRLARPGDMINTNARDLRFLDLLEADMTSGGARPSTSAALTKINEMRAAMQNGQVPARQMLDFYRSINEHLTNFGAHAVEGTGKAEHVFRLRQAQQLTNNMLNRYGRTQNPQFLESFRENNLAWASLQQSDNVAKFVRKNYTKPFVSEAAKGIFMNAGGKGIAVATGLTALERLQSFVRRLENPILRRYYGDVLRHSIESNVPAMMKSLNSFDKTAKQLEDQ